MTLIENFEQFFKKHTTAFYFFLVTPLAKSSRIFKPIFRTFLTAFLLLQWTGVLYVSYTKVTSNDAISKVANWIQMWASSLALTTAIYCTAFRATQFHSVIDQFQAVDEQFQRIGVEIDYLKHLRYSKGVVCIFIVLLLSLLSNDFVVTVHLNEMTSVTHWFVSVLSLAVNSLALLQAMFLIYFIKIRCSYVNQELGRIQGSREVPATKTFLSAGTTPAITLSTDKETLHELITMTNELCKLSKKINEFGGIFFLAISLALFSVAAIQLYYCYVVIVSESLGVSKLVIGCSIILVLWNLGLIVGLTTICEQVSDEGQKILQSSLSLHLKDTQLSSWIHPMVSQLRFTAFGFFNLDHGMLCSFMAALITYLIIFMQFYENFKNVDGGLASIRN